MSYVDGMLGWIGYIVKPLALKTPELRLIWLVISVVFAVHAFEFFLPSGDRGELPGEVRRASTRRAQAACATACGAMVPVLVPSSWDRDTDGLHCLCDPSPSPVRSP